MLTIWEARLKTGIGESLFQFFTARDGEIGAAAISEAMIVVEGSSVGRGSKVGP